MTKASRHRQLVIISLARLWKRIQGLQPCGICSAVVPLMFMNAHLDWHNRLLDWIDGTES